MGGGLAGLKPARTRRPKGGGLHSKGGGEPRATRTSCVRNHSGAGATPAPPLRRLMMTPSREQAMPSVQGLKDQTTVIRITVFARWGWKLQPQRMPTEATYTKRTPIFFAERPTT